MTVDVDDEESFVRAVTSFRVDLCLKTRPSLVHGGGEPPVPEGEKVAKRRKSCRRQ